MLKETLTVSALIAVILLVRAVFRNRVPKRMLYGLWLVVLLKLLLPGTLISLPVLPAEEAAAPVQSAAVQPEEAPAMTAPAVQTPAQQASEQQPPAAMPPAAQPQEVLKPAARVLTRVQVLLLIRVCGSVLLGLWMFASWLVFLIRLRKDRRFLGRHGKTRIYVSGAVKSPCLAGLVPAVYLTQDVLNNETTELILQHELTHLHHLDFLWAFCRTAAVIVYWWNPFVWAAAIVSKRDAELACDEAVAAKLDTSARLAYANAILALAPRKQAALSLAGSPVRERILFLTKKQRTSGLCIVLALVLVVSAAGCSITELTQRKSGDMTLSGQSLEDVPVKASPGRRCKTGEALLTGRYIRTEDGQDAFLFERNGQDTLALLINWTGKDEPFRKMETGDLIWVKYPFVPFEDDAQILTIHAIAAGKDHSRAPFHAEIPSEYLEKLAAFGQRAEENAQAENEREEETEQESAPQPTAAPKTEESPVQPELFLPQFEGGITMFAGETTAYVNSVPMQMEAAPFVENGIFFFPLQFAAQAYGMRYEKEGSLVTLEAAAHTYQYLLGTKTFIVDDMEYHPKELAFLFDTTASEGQMAAAAPYYVPQERDGVAFFPCLFGAGLEGADIPFWTSHYPQWDMVILEGNAQELGISGFFINQSWDELPENAKAGLQSKGTIGSLEAECCDVEEYEGNGLHVFVARQKEGTENPGLNGVIISVFTTTPDVATPRGVRCGDTEGELFRAYGFGYCFPWMTFGYDVQDGIITRVGFQMLAAGEIPEIYMQAEHWNDPEITIPEE